MEITENEIEEILTPELDNIRASMESIFSRIEDLYNENELRKEDVIRIENYFRDQIRGKM